MCEFPFHCLARSCHLEVLMVISIDTLLIKQLVIVILFDLIWHFYLNLFVSFQVNVI